MARTEGIDVVACERCPALVGSRSRIVNGVGPADAALQLVGEGPGAEEDRLGEPFVGRSGAVLDQALADVGLDRDDVRITNCIRCRPPGNRDPTDEELDNCRPFLEAEIETVDADVIVALGKVPSEHLLGRRVAVTREAGTEGTVRIGDADRSVLVCVHPAASLYDPNQRETLDGVLRRAAERVGAVPADAGAQSGLDDF